MDQSEKLDELLEAFDNWLKNIKDSSMMSLFCLTKYS